jgi:ketosteroid isomerase-like protein
MTSTPTYRTPLQIMELLSATWFPAAMGDPATALRWEELFDEDIVLIEPDSLPHGGRHAGLDGFRAAQAGMRALWEQRIDSAEYWQCAPDLAALRIVIEWTARATGRAVLLPMIDLIRVRAGRIVEVEAFVHDTAALLGTLD